MPEFLDYISGPITHLGLGGEGWGGDTGRRIKEYFLGAPGRTEQISTMTPQQQALQNQVIGQAGNALNRLQNNPFDFAPIREQYQRRFEQETLPSIAERLTSLGVSPSSGARQMLYSQAGADLNSQLAALEAQLGLQSRGQEQGFVSNLLGQGFNPSFDTVQHEPTAGLLHNILTAFSGGVGGAIPGLLSGNPFAAATGGGMGALSQWNAPSGPGQFVRGGSMSGQIDPTRLMRIRQLAQRIRGGR